MGRKAKLKRQRKQQIELNNSSSLSQPTKDFVKQIERQGYQFDKIARSPNIPTDKIEPQL